MREGKVFGGRHPSSFASIQRGWASIGKFKMIPEGDIHILSGQETTCTHWRRGTVVVMVAVQKAKNINSRRPVLGIPFEVTRVRRKGLRAQAMIKGRISPSWGRTPLQPHDPRL